MGWSNESSTDGRNLKIALLSPILFWGVESRNGRRDWFGYCGSLHLIFFSYFYLIFPKAQPEHPHISFPVPDNLFFQVSLTEEEGTLTVHPCHWDREGTNKSMKLQVIYIWDSKAWLMSEGHCRGSWICQASEKLSSDLGRKNEYRRTEVWQWSNWACPTCFTGSLGFVKWEKEFTVGFLKTWQRSEWKSLTISTT